MISDRMVNGTERKAAKGITCPNCGRMYLAL
jgi:hypothetical protein